jgi:cyclophilin family peptidyl-prolyl cis-trans isomerase
MIRFALVLALLTAVAVAMVVPASAEEKKDKKNPVVVMKTSMGDMEIELYEKEAPITVQNFLWYVKNGFYDGLAFHRVMDGFMVQGGGFTPDLKRKEGNDPIENEATNGLSNEHYTIAMARTPDINSATSQFFINDRDNANLDYVNQSKYGYCVFGKVIAGQEVVDKISEVPVTTKNGMKDVPVETVVIIKAYIEGEKSSKKQKTSE